MPDAPYQPPKAHTGGPDSPGTPPLTVAGNVRAFQVITAALVLGVLTFMGVTLVMNEAALSTEPDFLSWFGIGLAVLILPAQLVVSAVIRRQQLAGIDPEQLRTADDDGRFMLLIPVLRSTHIISCAMLEGAAFLNLVMYMLTQFIGNIGVAMLLVLRIAAKFPTEARLRSWVRLTSENMELR